MIFVQKCRYILSLWKVRVESKSERFDLFLNRNERFYFCVQSVQLHIWLLCGNALFAGRLWESIRKRIWGWLKKRTQSVGSRTIIYVPILFCLGAQLKHSNSALSTAVAQEFCVLPLLSWSAFFLKGDHQNSLTLYSISTLVKMLDFLVILSFCSGIAWNGGFTPQIFWLGSVLFMI